MKTNAGETARVEGSHSKGHHDQQDYLEKSGEDETSELRWAKAKPLGAGHQCVKTMSITGLMLSALLACTQASAGLETCGLALSGGFSSQCLRLTSLRIMGLINFSLCILLRVLIPCIILHLFRRWQGGIDELNVFLPDWHSLCPLHKKCVYILSQAADQVSFV